MCHPKIRVKNQKRMVSCSKLGETIIDELRLCYIAEPSLLNDLSSVPLGERIDFVYFSMVRIIGQHFRYLFKVLDAHNNQVGNLYFGQYGNSENYYVWLRIDNRVLYNRNWFEKVLNIPCHLKLTFNNITAIDLTKDFKKNIVNVIRRLYKDEAVTTIVNGKAIKDRKRIIPEFHIDYSVSLERLKNPTFYAKQKKALHDKTKGICVCCYDKKAEVETESHKQYILDFYNNPKSLHRLEIHLNADEIRTYCSAVHMVQSVDLIFDKEFLTNMFYYHLAAVVRFTRGRTKLDWRDILM